MSKEVKRFTSSKGKVYVQIVEYSGIHWVLVVNDRLGWVDNPIQYKSGRIVYDDPYKVPKYAKELVVKAFEWRNKNTPALYTLDRTLNLPDKTQFFVSCNRADMQPYRCDTIIAKNFSEAFQVIVSHAHKMGYTQIEIVQTT